MRRTLLIATVIVLTHGLLASAPAAAAPPPEPTQVTNYGTKPPVTFDHARHADLACADCHHQEETGQYRCGACHGETAQKDAPKLKDAMHGKDTGKCYACHFGAEPRAKKLKCSECHLKR